MKPAGSSRGSEGSSASTVGFFLVQLVACQSRPIGIAVSWSTYRLYKPYLGSVSDQRIIKKVLRG